MDRQHRAWGETCKFCPTLCLYTCPVSNAEGRDTVATWGKMSTARWLDEGVMPLTEESAAILYKCLGCLACYTPCRHDVQVPPVLVGARARAVATGVRPYPVEPFRRDDEETLRRLRELAPAERFVEEAQVLLLPGADTVAKTPEVVSDALRAADALGIDYLALGEASALGCGYPLWAAGYHDELVAVARRVNRAFARYKLVVAMSPHDVYMLRVVYPELDLAVSPRVAYVGDVLLDHLRRERPKRATSAAADLGRVRYHDPCYLGRHLGIYDTPRALVAAAMGEAPRELRWHHDSTYCCGGGGGLDVTSPETAGHAARTVVENARVLGTDVLVTACASCTERFRQVDGAPRVADVVSLLADALAPTTDA